MKSRLLAVAAFVSAVALGAPPARADPVTIDFEWTLFGSVVEPPNSVPAQIFIETDGIATQVSPSPAQGMPFSLAISSTSDRVDFYSGTSTHNAVSFIANPNANVGVGDTFLFGTLQLWNGIWFGQADLTFTMTTVSANAALNGHTYTDTLRMVQNPFDLNPALSADTFYVVSLYHVTPDGVQGAVSVYELFDSPTGSNTGTVELWGKIGSLIPLELRNPQGAAFVPITAAVPEPSEGLLLLTGLAGMALFAKRRRLLPAPRPAMAALPAMAL